MATVIGQFVSLIVAMVFYYGVNKEINGNPKYIKPDLNIIKGIYQIQLFLFCHLIMEWKIKRELMIVSNMELLIQ